MSTDQLDVNLADPNYLPYFRGPPYQALAKWRAEDPVLQTAAGLQ